MNNAKKKLFALGRLKTGEMNKTEKEYSQHLTGLMAIGEIVWWRFEGVKFRLADNCFYTPDFVVMKPDGEIHVIDVKGSLTFIQDDAKVKGKVCAEQFPFRFFFVAPRAKCRGGGWEVKEIGNKP